MIGFVRNTHPKTRKLAAHASTPKLEAQTELSSNPGDSSSAKQSAPRIPVIDSSRTRDTIDPLAADRYKVQFTANQALRNKIDRAKELLPVGAGDLPGLFERALDLLIDDLERKKVGSKKRCKVSRKQNEQVPGPATQERSKQNEQVPGPVANESAKRTGKRSRYIASSVRRAVFDRDGGQCSFTRPGGRRCSERQGLEFHHLKPYAQDGQHSAENLTLHCKTHNLYAAERDFGKPAIERFRCREPAARYSIASVGSTPTRSGVKGPRLAVGGAITAAPDHNLLLAMPPKRSRQSSRSMYNH